MHLIYIDDSGDEETCIFSALAIPAASWRDTFLQVKEFRKKLKQSDEILIQAEFHAWKFVSGRGHLGPRIINKTRRCDIFRSALSMVAAFPGAKLFNICFPARQEERAFEWLLNRINRTLQTSDSHAVLICDQGKEVAYTRLTRRMGIYNPIPSQFGDWIGSGDRTKNIPIDRILEDPFFKISHQSYFVQLADFCAYALLRKERPLPSKNQYGLHEAFFLLEPILAKEATRKDPHGIIRP